MKDRELKPGESVEHVPSVKHPHSRILGQFKNSRLAMASIEHWSLNGGVLIILYGSLMVVEMRCSPALGGKVCSRLQTYSLTSMLVCYYCKCYYCKMGGWLDGWLAGWLHGWMDGRRRVLKGFSMENGGAHNPPSESLKST